MGRPKAWLPFGGETLLGRVVRLLGEAVAPVVVVAAAEQDLPPLPGGVRVVRDEERGRGPLQGMAAGLDALAEKGQRTEDAGFDIQAAFISSCDVPFLRPALVRRMLALLGDHAVCVPRVGERHHPLAAVYRMEVLPVIRALLAENRLRPFYLFEKVTTRVVEAEELADVDPAFASLRNLNTPEDYDAAIHDVAERELGNALGCKRSLRRTLWHVPIE
jgi:molybdopterin-guanine dinucleotide biosynthesis protein A